MPADQVYEMLATRERIASTVVRPGLAIPHLIREGVEGFQILLVRCRDGVVFAEGEPPVRAIFVVATSPQQRNLYLKALVAIAEIAQEEKFDRRWMQARSLEALREIVLAAERSRAHL